MTKPMVKEKLNISISKELKDALKKICDEEHRSCSKQVIHMFEFYIKHRNKNNKNGR